MRPEDLDVAVAYSFIHAGGKRDVILYDNNRLIHSLL